MRSKFAESGFQIPLALDSVALEKVAPMQFMATAKPSFMNARPSLLAPVSFEAPLPQANPVPLSTRGPGPIQLPIMPVTPCSAFTQEPY